MPRKTDSGNPRDWMTFVSVDLDAVKLLIEHETAFAVARVKLAEALEKALKADLIQRGWKLEKVHDLQKLCDYLAQFDTRQADSLQPLVDELAESYTISRYPGFEMDEPDWPALRKLADHVIRYASRLRMMIEDGENVPRRKRPENI